VLRTRRRGVVVFVQVGMAGTTNNRIPSSRNLSCAARMVEKWLLLSRTLFCCVLARHDGREKGCLPGARRAVWPVCSCIRAAYGGVTRQACLERDTAREGHRCGPAARGMAVVGQVGRQGAPQRRNGAAAGNQGMSEGITVTGRRGRWCSENVRRRAERRAGVTVGMWRPVR